jgi:hypothetical protein
VEVAAAALGHPRSARCRSSPRRAAAARPHEQRAQ